VYQGDHFWVGDVIVLRITTTVSIGDTAGNPQDKGKVHPRTGHDGRGGGGEVEV
jgi:hypothetical protein